MSEARSLRSVMGQSVIGRAMGGMMRRTDRWVVAIVTPVLSLGFAADARAELIDRGTSDGVKLIYDSTQNITWLGDANWAKTSGFDATGEMPWDEASAWASDLRIGGFSDWRLPLTFDETCRGAGCTNSEMGHLFNVQGISSADPGPFLNVQEHQYWSRRGSSSEPDLAWYVHFGSGNQTVASKSDGHMPWAVRDGDVGSEVSIDTKPGSFAKRVNLGSRGSTPAAVLGSVLPNVDDIDVSTLTLTLGVAGVNTVGEPDLTVCSLQDVSGDFSAVREVASDGREPRLADLTQLRARPAGERRPKGLAACWSA